MRPVPFTNSTYEIIFFSAYGLWVFGEFTGARFKSAATASRRDRGSYTILKALLWVSITADFVLAFQFPRASIATHRVVVFFIGIALMILGMIFRVYAMRTLGRFFTYQVAIQPGQTVVQSGPYRFVRHPSYTGGLVTLFGLTLALGNRAGIAVVICMLIAYSYRMRVEEGALLTALGDPYRQYMRHTTRLIPFVF